MTKATTAMFEAILANDPAALSAALLAGASVNSKYEEETPVVCLALESRRARELLPLLLAHNAPLNRTDAMGATPLERAIEKEEPELVEALLRAGANPNALTADEGPLLHLALDARQHSTRMAELLLAHKAKPNALGLDDSPALEIAIERGELALLQALLSAGANPNVNDATGCYPMLHRAMTASKNAPEMTRLLLAHKANPSAVDEEGRPALQIAIEALDAGMTQALLNAGANPNAMDEMGETPMLGLALDERARRPELATALLAAGANPSSVDSLERPPLQIALESEDLELVSALLKAGADPNALADSDTDSMLRVAMDARSHKREMVQALLAYRANPNVLDGMEQSALELAIEQADMALVSDLLRAGANPNLAASDGGTLLSLAMGARERSTEMAEALLSHQANPSAVDDHDRPPLQVAIEARDLRLTTALLRAGADANAWDDFESSPMLHLALGADAKKMELASALLIHGADPSRPDGDGSPPLQLAIEQGDPELAAALLRHGADANARDEDETPLLLRAIDAPHKAERLVDELLRRGADPSLAFDSEGRGPLEAALQAGSSEMTLALLRHGADPKRRSSDEESLMALAIDQGQSDIAELLTRYATGRARPEPMPRAPAEPPVVLEPPPPAIPPNVKRRSIMR